MQLLHHYIGPPTRERQVLVLTVNRYKVTVITGTKRRAGTDADVRITLFGDVGESGERKLDTKMKNNFEAGSSVHFALFPAFYEHCK